MIKILQSIKDCANKACEAAYEKRLEIGGAVNWADLSCTEVRYWQNDSGQDGFSVLIEEADPGSADLLEFIYEWLRQNGFGNIEINAEW